MWSPSYLFDSLLHIHRQLSSKKNVFFLSESNQASTLANSITGVTSKVMVAILGGENPTRVVVFLPSPRALPAQGGAVVRAAVVDAVHVGHQNLNTKVEVLLHEKAQQKEIHLAVPTHCVLVYIRPGAFIAHSYE